MERWNRAVRALPSEPVLSSLFAMLFLVPMAATLGQFWHSGFLGQQVSVLVMGWPGTDWKLLSVSGWLITAVIALLYVGGIVWLMRRRTFGEVVLWGIACAVAGAVIGSGFSLLTGWHDIQQLGSPDLTGKVDRLILNLWYNPIWEEVVFRGFPLLLLIVVGRAKGQVALWAQWTYLLIPSAAFAAYHVPNHGPARLADTFFVGVAFAWLARRYSFFAPLALHMMMDAQAIPTGLLNRTNLPLNEARWLLTNRWLLNTSFSVILLAVLGCVPLLVLWRWWYPAGMRGDHEAQSNHVVD